MTTLLVIGLIFASYGAGRFYQFVRDARSGMGLDKYDKRKR